MMSSLRELPLTTIRRDGLTFEVGAGEEWIYDHNITTLRAVEGPLRLVIDIGAHVGFTTLPSAHRGARVLALEPNPYNYASLVRNIQRNRLHTQVVPLQVALAQEDGLLASICANICNIGAGGMCQNDQQPVVGSAVTITPQWLCHSFLGSQMVDYLKMDIEGYEHYVLPLFPESIWLQIRYIHMEIHDIESPGQKRFHASWGKNIDVAAFLSARGFVQLDGLPVWKRKE